MYTVRKEFKFCASHQLVNSYSPRCKETIHGHNFKVEVFIKAEKLDSTGMVLDFGYVKDLFFKYIDALDHSVMLPFNTNMEYKSSIEKNNIRVIITPFNPTAENLSKYLFDIFNGIIGSESLGLIYINNPQISKVIVWETDSSYAIYEPNISSKGECSCPTK